MRTHTRTLNRWAQRIATWGLLGLVATIAVSALGFSAEVGWTTRKMSYGVGVQHCALFLNHTPVLEQGMGSIAGSYYPRFEPRDMALKPTSGPHWLRNITSVPLWWIAVFCAVLKAACSRFRSLPALRVGRASIPQRFWLHARRTLLCFALTVTLVACAAPWGLYIRSAFHAGAASVDLALLQDTSWGVSLWVSSRTSAHEATVMSWQWADGLWNSVSQTLPRWLTDWYVRVPTWLVVPICLAGYLVARRQSPALKPTQCRACGYDLTGLATGAVCPECGTSKPPDA